MDKLIEIQREIDRKMGNQMIIDKIRSGAYRLKTGEAGEHELRDSFYAERFDEGFRDMVRHVDKEEKLGLDEYEVRNHAENLQRQMSEGRKSLSFWAREKKGEPRKIEEEKGEKGEEEEKEKKTLFFFE